MIEVEKKYVPNEAQADKMKESLVFMSEIENHDIYYDFPDFRLYKKKVKLRKRNGSFELKIKMEDYADKEIEDLNSIKDYFNVQGDLEGFVTKELVVLAEFKTNRQKYTLTSGPLIIDFDQTDFGASSCDIEIMVPDETQILSAKEKIKDFADQYGLEKSSLSKIALFLKKNNPSLYQELYEKK